MISEDFDVEIMEKVFQGHERQQHLLSFIKESNAIEGITRAPTKAEINEASRFMNLNQITIEDLEAFVSIYQPGAVLRDREGIDVSVRGQYVPPRGSPFIRKDLNHLLFRINEGELTAWQAHNAYETLHPFRDGNGRSGRMLWAWQMGWGELRLGFLRMFYYQTLQQTRL